MKAVWLEDRKLCIRDDVPAPEPPDGEVLIRVLEAGICNTDIELTRGYYPYKGILGHEFVGVVDDGPDHLVGKRVVGEINVVCGDGGTCREGRPTHCERRTVLGIVNRAGAFAEYLTLPAANLHVVPDEVSTDAATFVEPVAAALEIQERVAVECTGNSDGFALARRGLRPRGILIMKSTYAGELSFDASSLVVDEITLVGSRCGPFPPAIRLLAEGRVDVEPLIHARYPLSDAVAAFERVQRPAVLKVLLEM